MIEHNPNPAYVLVWVDTDNRIRDVGIYSEPTPTQMGSSLRPHTLCTVYMRSFQQAQEYAKQWLRSYSMPLYEHYKQQHRIAHDAA